MAKPCNIEKQRATQARKSKVTPSVSGQHKTKVSISFKNIAAGITRDNYVAQSGNSIAGTNNSTSNSNCGEANRAFDSAKLAARMNLNMKLKQKIMGKRPELAQFSNDSSVSNSTVSSSGISGGFLRFPDSNDVASKDTTSSLEQVLATLSSADKFEYSQLQPVVIKKNCEKKKIQPKIRKTKKGATGIESDPEDIVKSTKNETTAQTHKTDSAHPPSQNISCDMFTNLNSKTLLPPIDTSSQEQVISNTPYSATSSTFGYQMLYLPVQLPLSPSLLSPVSNQSTPLERIANITDEKVTDPDAKKIPQMKTLSTAVSLSSLFHPTLQSQLSNSQLFSQLGLHLSSPNLGTTAGSSCEDGISSSKSGSSPLIGVLLASIPTSSVTEKPTSTSQLASTESAEIISPKAKLTSPDSMPLTTPSRYQLAFLQQKQLQAIARQHGLIGEPTSTLPEKSLPTECISDVGTSTNCAMLETFGNHNAPVMLKAPSLSFLFPSTTIPKDYLTETAGRQGEGQPKKRKRESLKGKEPADDEQHNNCNAGLLFCLTPEKLAEMHQQPQNYAGYFGMSQQKDTCDDEAQKILQQSKVKTFLTPVVSFSSPDWLAELNSGTDFTKLNTEMLAAVPLFDESSLSNPSAFLGLNHSEGLHPFLIPVLQENHLQSNYDGEIHPIKYLLGLSADDFGGAVDSQIAESDVLNGKLSPQLFGLL
ncbi:hypothetical protein HDU83_002834 [Entophlyctis luteolus]|nr:hypothetical protein HDU83_002834 [Entophlyctis luteolus]